MEQLSLARLVFLTERYLEQSNRDENIISSAIRTVLQIFQALGRQELNDLMAANSFALNQTGQQIQISTKKILFLHSFKQWIKITLCLEFDPDNG